MSVSRLNGWQCLWLVLTGSALVASALIVPLVEVYTPQMSELEYRRRLIAELTIPACAAYVQANLTDLERQTLGKGTCCHVYNARTEEDVRPYTLAAYDAWTKRRDLSAFSTQAGFNAGLVLTISGLLYVVGSLVAWIRHGFLRGSGNSR